MSNEVIQDNNQSVYNAIDQLLKNAEGMPESYDLISRTIIAMAHALYEITDDLPKIKGIRTAEGTELMALVTQEVLSHNSLIPKRAQLKLRGRVAFREQLTKAGGIYSSQEVSEILGISSSAVRKRVERKNLLAISFNGKLQLPVWQFSEAGVVDGFSNILSLLKSTTAISAVQFFLTYAEDLKATPIEVLTSGNHSKIKLVHLLAQQWQQPTAR